MILFPRPHLWIPRSPAPLLMAPPWDEEAARALEYTDNISCGMPALGVFVPCAGTAGFHSASPNDLRIGGNWTDLTATMVVTFGVTDPSSGLTASDIRTNSGGGVSFGAGIISGGAGSPFTMNAAPTTYSFGAYFKWIAGPVWLLVDVSDGVANAVGSWFNIATPAAGTPRALGTGTLTCAQAAPAGNGYTQISFAGTLSSTNTGMKLEIYLVDGDGTSLSTVNQEFFAWQVCP